MIFPSGVAFYTEKIMTNRTPMIQDALYFNVENGMLFKFLGMKTKVVVVQRCDNEGFPDDDWEPEIVKNEDFHEYFMDYGVHSHSTACCEVHGTHSSPHQGCLLR